MGENNKDDHLNALSLKDYLLLRAWYESLTHESINQKFLKFLHKIIENNDYSELTSTEKNILQQIFISGDITHENLYKYFNNYKNLKFKKSFSEKVMEFFGQYVQIKLPRETEEDFFLIRDRVYRFEVSEKLHILLDHHEFNTADRFCLQNPDIINQDAYDTAKGLVLQKYFSENFLDEGAQFRLDQEQAKAVGCLGQNILISARAGSGKTRILIAKILYLLEKEHLKEEDILVLAFNKNVPKEIHERLNGKVYPKIDSDKYKNLNVASTFHKLAKNLAGYSGGILAENKIEFIKIIIEYLKKNDPIFIKNVYKFYKGISKELVPSDFDNTESYYSYLRNSSFTTLKGETVKSRGEKWIADFLYEHDVDYIYEKIFYPNKIKLNDPELKELLKIYKYKETLPDFYLPKYNFVWEHWGIDENETDLDRKNEFDIIFNTTWQKYFDSMKWKRNFWGDWRKEITGAADQWVTQILSIDKLIETSVVDCGKPYNRAIFEERLKVLLTSNGVTLEKKDINDLIQEVWGKNIDNLTRLINSFINRFQLKFFNNRESFLDEVENYKNDNRVYNFLKLSLQVFCFYEEQIQSDNKIEELKGYDSYKIDFNQLLLAAVNNIEKGEVDQEVHKFKWILIDEYQDFSELFFRLIQAIQTRNPELKTLVVGDNWQAINRFAGSDTKYFDKFDEYFGDTNTKTIATNYRSKEGLIKASNKFMIDNKFQGEPAKSVSIDNKQCVFLEDINSVKIEYWKYNADYYSDQDYINTFVNSNGTKEPRALLKASYLKKCVEIIKENKNKKFLILHTTNNFLGKDLKVFKDRLCRMLIKKGVFHSYELTDDKVQVKTMHRSKGLEADVVLLLEINKGVIPMNHPDNILFRIFGENIKTNQDDQKRLFYVAMTRAKEKLYILSERSKVSEYANCI